MASCACGKGGAVYSGSTLAISNWKTAENPPSHGFTLITRMVNIASLNNSGAYRPL